MMRDRRNRLLSLVALTLLGAAALPTSASAADGSIARLQVVVGSFCIDGKGEPDRLHTVTLRAPDGTLRARSSERSDSHGRFFVCPLTSGLSLVNPGDTVVVRTRAGSETMRVPDLRPRIDRDKDSIWGRGPKGSTVQVEVDHASQRPRTWDLPVDDRGYWRLDTTGAIDLIGADRVEVRLRRGDDTIAALGYAPYLALGPASNFVTGAVRVGTQPTVTVARDGRTYAAAPVVSVVGSLLAFLETPNGRAVYPRAGDVVRSSVAGGIRLRIPEASVSGDAGNHSVHLSCLPRAAYTVTVRDAKGYWMDLLDGKTDASGSATRSVGLRKGYTLSASCQYPGGDMLLLEGLAD